MIPVALYVRVSTDGGGQTVSNQLLELRRVAQFREWEIVEEFSDLESGSVGRAGRPGYAALCDAITRGRIKMVLAWSIDRVSRSLGELITWLDDANKVGVGLYFHQQQIDTSTPAGRAMFQMCGVFAELERNFIRERTKAGLARTRAEGMILGKKKRDDEHTARARRMLEQGMPINKTARECGLPNGVVDRIRKDMIADGVAVPFKPWSEAERAARRKIKEAADVGSGGATC